MRQAGVRQATRGWLSALALALLTASPAYAHAEHRREASQLGQFEAALAAQPSATKALQQWCTHLTGAESEPILATSVVGQDAPAPHDLHSLLQTDAPLGYRHVRLECSVGTLSEAHNWFVPARLTPEMNATLATTNTPFGKVVAPLHFTREPLASQRGRGPGCPTHTILTHRALLRLPDGTPLALVVECYSALNLAPPRQVLRHITVIPYDPQHTCWYDSDGHMQGPHCPAPSQAPSPTLP